MLMVLGHVDSKDHGDPLHWWCKPDQGRSGSTVNLTCLQHASSDVGHTACPKWWTSFFAWRHLWLRKGHNTWICLDQGGGRGVYETGHIWMCCVIYWVACKAFGFEWRLERGLWSRSKSSPSDSDLTNPNRMKVLVVGVFCDTLKESSALEFWS